MIIIILTIISLIDKSSMTVAINITVGKEFPSAHLFQGVPPKYKINKTHKYN